VTHGPSELFASLTPGLRIDAAQRISLDRGEVIVKALPARDRELAVFAAVRLNAPPERLIAWMREIATLQRGRHVPVIVRFSDPPRLEDLDGLAVDEDDLKDIRSCRPGHCGVKLSTGEIARLQRRLRADGDWKCDVQDEFKQIVFDRVQGYLANGDFGVPPYHDDATPVSADVEFASLMDRFHFLMPDLPGVAEYLQLYPRMEHPGVVESFLYWSKETLGVKPITSVTHLSLIRGSARHAADAYAVSKQVFATHYKDGAVSVIAITGTGSGPTPYLVYVHRSHVDVLHGMFGGVVRRMIERRIQQEGLESLVLEAYRSCSNRANSELRLNQQS
jgi:hypothetical protein